MKRIRNAVKIAMPVLGIAATLAIAQQAPAPVCIIDFPIPDGACSKWIDETDPNECPDEVLNTQECRDTAHGPNGSAQRGSYSSECQMRIWKYDIVWDICRPTMVPPRSYRCYRATGPACEGGCQNGC